MLDSIQRWVVKLWNDAVPEPRWVSTLYTIGYFVMAVTGIVTLIVPPQTLSCAVGVLSMQLAALLWLIGGFIGMVPGQREWWAGERFALATMLTGIIFYAWIVTGLHMTQPGSRLTQLGMLIIAALFLLVRFGFIWRYPYKPRG